MAYNIVFSDEAIRDLDRMDKVIVERIVKKLRWLVLQENLLDFAKRLKYDAIGQYRFRVGDYRVAFDGEKNEIIILRVGHRSTIYK